MRKVASLFDWYWVMLSVWFIITGVIGLFNLTPTDIVRGMLALLALVGGIFWFFSGATQPNS